MKIRLLKFKSVKSTNNVALRLYKTARLHKKNFFIRISGDSPLIDYRILNKAIKIFENSKKKI